MSFGSFFTRALDVVTPWNRGGEVQRRQERKRREDEQRSFQRSQAPSAAPNVVRSNQNNSPNQNTPKPQKPLNIFEDLNKNLGLNRPQSNVSVPNQGVEAIQPDEPGTVVQPKAKYGVLAKDPGALQRSINQPSKIPSTASTIRQSLTVPIRSALRVVTGIGQGTSGLVDLATPGRGNSRVTNKLNSMAEKIDEDARKHGVETPYKITNVAGEIGSFAIPSTWASKAKGAANAARQVPNASRAARFLNEVDQIAPRTKSFFNNFADNAISRGTGQVAEEILDLRNVIPDVAITGKQMGENTARGNSTTPRSIAENIAMGVTGGAIAPALGAALRRIPGAADVIENFLRRSSVPNNLMDDVLSEADLNDITKTTDIPVRQNIPVNGMLSDSTDIPVQVRTPQRPIIREVGGDAALTTPNPQIANNVVDVRRAAAAAEVPPARPDMNIEGVTPRAPTKPFVLDEDTIVKGQTKVVDDYATMLRDVGEGNGTQLVPDGEGGYTRVSNNFRTGDNKGKRMSKADWRAEAERQLKDGKADPSIQKVYDESADPEVQALLSQGEPSNAPAGEPISVKDVKSIPVTDQTVVPQNLPETPGTVRVTESTAPSNAKSAAVAAQTPSVVLPKETQAILDNPKQFNKRQVAAARNQRKLARQMAKTQEETAAALERVNATKAPNEAIDGRQPGLVLSDEAKKGKKGVYQVAHQADQTNELGQKSIGQVIQEAEASKTTHGSLNDRDIANVKAALDSGTYKAGTPEYKKLSDLYWNDAGTHSGQQLALRNQSMHRTGSAKEIYSRAVSKIVALADDPAKITDGQIANIEKTVDDYVSVRDARLKAADDFNANPTKENYDRFLDLDKQATKAEKSMAMAQFTTAKTALKGNTNVKLRRLIEDAAENSDMYTMDFVDSSLLSGTGTFVRNFVNASLGSVEEGAFGGIGARIGRTVKGTPVGGGVGRGSFSGFSKGVSNIVDATKTRFKNAGKNPIEHMKNWSTTGNELGDSMIEGSTGRSVRNHYEQVLKEQGYKGKELRMRADVMARTDPDNLARDLYGPQARKDAGLGSGIAKRSTFEKSTQRWIADEVAKVMGKEYSQGGEALAKGITRITMGFPSAIGRSLVAGSQRIVPFANIDTVKAFTAPDKTLRAAAIKESIKKSGTAATAATVFGLMGANNMITGAYPKDPDERARWEREGIKENSIKLGDAWYDAPSYLGSFGLPVLAWASIGRNGGINKESLNDIKAIVGAISPTESLSDINDVLDGKTDIGKYTQQVVASAGRMATPYGSLLNQVSKIFDTTQNDTSSDSWAGGVLNKLIDGIPFVDRNLPTKTDKEGNPLYNPSTIETLAGASGAVQKGGEQRSAEINNEINTTLSKIDEYGLLADKNLEGVLESSGLEAYNKAKSGKQLDESEIKALKEGLVKGVSQEGTDTAYLEREQYDTNLAVLKLKRDLMNTDPTVKPSSLKDIDRAITRGEVYKANKTPYKLIQTYKDTSVTEWRNMGDPDSEDYDPDTYQKLWDIDKGLADKKVSLKWGDPEKQKYYAKKSGRGGRGRGGGGGRGGGVRNIDTSFGTLKTAGYAPRVQEYASIGQKSGQIPHISVKRPNIVHKITSSG